MMVMSASVAEEACVYRIHLTARHKWVVFFVAYVIVAVSLAVFGAWLAVGG